MAVTEKAFVEYFAGILPEEEETFDKAIAVLIKAVS